MRADFTPERIEELSSGEIFVFGSNLNGNHYGGAARIAYERFGAEWGVSEGLSGSTYAIPTLDKEMQPVSETDLFNSFRSFIAVIKQHPDLTFYLTKIGCGIAGWNVESVRKLLWKAIYEESGNKIPNNLVMPYEFYYERSERNKNRSRYGLYKLPSDVLLKHSQREVGELKAYVDELEHNIKELREQLQRQREDFNKYKNQNSQKIDISALHEAAHRVKSEEMYKGMKSQNKKLRNELKILRKSKNELLYKMVQVGYMKKNELSKVLEEERLRREQLGNLASSAVTEEERERYHNEIVDCESAIQSLEEDLKMYD